jgi:glycosyltransferase involved in cell wall biosynthesis
MLGDRAELHIRGNPSSGYEKVIEGIAKQSGVTLKLHLQIDHDDLIASLDQYDVGLALERPEKVNAALTVSNKIGSYLLAGLAIAASETPGQTEVMKQCPGVGFLYPPGNANRLADSLRYWVDDSEALKKSQQSSWRVARDRFCWDVEKQKWLGLFERDSKRKTA